MSNSLTRYETFLTSIANGEAPELVPITRKEMFLAKASGVDVGDITPITREEMFLNKITSGGGGELEIYIEGKPTLVRSNATKIADNAFKNMETLVEVDIPKCTTIGKYAFFDCYNLTTANFPNVIIIGNNTFEGCVALTTADFPKATTIGGYAFVGCYNLTTADFPLATSIGERAFINCKNLKALILRSPTMCDMDISAVVGTKIVDATGTPTGEGFIYVLTALYKAYIADLVPKAIALAASVGNTLDEPTATYMVTAMLRKLEDYTVDGTTTGELDESKI